MTQLKKQTKRKGVRNVEICAAIVADKPPQLPLREELQSLGFEVVLGASGTGLKASKYESERAVKAYRRDIELRDLRKRRLFPKSPRRIREKIDSRRRIEHTLSLPHACSYESYDIKLQRSRLSAPLPHESDFSTSSSSGRDDSFGYDLNSRACKPHYLAPEEDYGETDQSSGADEVGKMEVFDVPDVFGAFDDLDETSSLISDVFQSDNDKNTPISRARPIHTTSTNPFDYDEEEEKKQEDESAPGEHSRKEGHFYHATDVEREWEKRGLHGVGQHPSEKNVIATGEERETREPIDKQYLGDLRNEEIPLSNTSRAESVAVSLGSIDPRMEKINELIQASQEDAFEREQATLSSIEPHMEKIDNLMQDTHEATPEREQEAEVPTEIPRPHSGSSKGTHSVVEQAPVFTESNNPEGLRPRDLEPRSSNGEEQAEILQGTLQSWPVKNNSKQVSNWMLSAKSVLENLSTEVFKATVCDKRRDGLEETVGSVVEDPLSSLFALLARPDLPIHRVESILADSPELPQVKRHQDGRLPLHLLCDKPMRTGMKGFQPTSTEGLVKDIELHKNAIAMLVGFYPDACTQFDENGDLPLHLVGRKLMEWEATWYEGVYQAAANESDGLGEASSAVTHLYLAMSETIESLVTPIFLGNDKECYTAPGSMGTILPLHMASIFTTSVKSLRLLLENYPDGAFVQCDLGILQTFVPDECLALELHDNLSTDLPKWEIALREDSADKGESDEDSILRSDLLFAYNPIEPHRFEKERIRRFEARIQFDATIILVKNPPKLDRVNENIWQWMCTFKEADSGRSTYVSSVKRIVSVLTYQPLQLLATMQSLQGDRLIDVANEDCAKVIKKRLTELQDEIAVERRVPKTKPDVVLPDKGFVEYLCRLVFDLPQTPHRSSFIILPYALKKKGDGTFGLKSTSDKGLASKFAGCLVALTDPDTILQMLDHKWMRYYGQSIFGSKVKNQKAAYGNVQVHMDNLLSLYQECGMAYFYFIEAESGLPEVGESVEFALYEPADQVKKLIPLMIPGMVQMRGQTAISRLASVFMHPGVSTIVSSWLEAGDALEALLLRDRERGMVDDDPHLGEVIRKYRSLAAHQIIDTQTSGGEWAEEVAALREILGGGDGVSSKEMPNPNNACPKKTLIDLVNYSEEAFINTRVSSPEVIDLTKKLDELSHFQDFHLYADGAVDVNKETSQMKDVGVFLVSPEENPRENIVEEIPSRYSPLFDGLAMNRHVHQEEARDEVDDECGICVWNNVDQVWEDVWLQLNTRGKAFSDDPKVVRLKVDLADQARKLASLRLKVSHLRRNKRSPEEMGVEVLDLTNIKESATFVTPCNSISDARDLVIRMGDLEERLVCDEIQIQHLSMEAYSVEYEGHRLLSDRTQPPGSKRNQFPLVVQDKSSGPGFSGIRYEANTVSDSSSGRRSLSDKTAPVKAVRFEEALDLTGIVELETSSSSCTTSNLGFSKHLIDKEFFTSSVALDSAGPFDLESAPEASSESSRDLDHVPDQLLFNRNNSSRIKVLPLESSSSSRNDSAPEKDSDSADSIVRNDRRDISPSTNPPDVARTAVSDDSGIKAVAPPAQTDEISSERESIVTVWAEPRSQASRPGQGSQSDRISSERESMVTLMTVPRSPVSRPVHNVSTVGSAEPLVEGISLLLERQAKLQSTLSRSPGSTTPDFSKYPCTPADHLDVPSLTESSASPQIPLANQSRSQKLCARRKRIRALKSRGSYGGSSISAESSRPSARLRIVDAEQFSIDETDGSKLLSVFRPQTINVHRALPAVEYSGLSSFSNNDLASEIDNLISRYTYSQEEKSILGWGVYGEKSI